jgi:hypothetical protein
MNLIEEIKKKVEIEIRLASRGDSYLEAVVATKDLQSLRTILTIYLGPAAKEPDKKRVFPSEVEELIDALGGLRSEQSFFYKQEGNKILYAALWPWQSNREKVTLKVGTHP